MTLFLLVYTGTNATARSSGKRSLRNYRHLGRKLKVLKIYLILPLLIMEDYNFRGERKLGVNKWLLGRKTGFISLDMF